MSLTAFIGFFDCWTLGQAFIQEQFIWYQIKQIISFNLTHCNFIIMTMKSFEIICCERQCLSGLSEVIQFFLLNCISFKPSLLVAELSNMLKNEYVCVICLVLGLEPVSCVLFIWDYKECSKFFKAWLLLLRFQNLAPLKYQEAFDRGW